ncbi:MULTISPECIES: AAA family ATPase [unclassified Actinopolyspora]|uniref:AAA family ATPase n=1 Tax=unclassified Actinopolyspora TaxID=2639451 RepID=UPI0013F6234A|nr:MULTISPECIES: AAA family ATPase [unclassified Actinopolyspora]NHD16039.1 AAA family ATPase [Actinopolyspora sp. BKK2]NHE74747.1 AAA family ATPase [Actinopolyspora sp. BKK1]
MDTPADTRLISLVRSRLNSESPPLRERVRRLVLAALEDDQRLRAALDGTHTPTTTDDTEHDARNEAAPAGTYLHGIEVSGFRGIGARTKLPLHPAPGLTIVAGRNGSGKSSFAEALELALTGNSYRWSTKSSAFWKETWRNVHQNVSPSVRIDLAEETAGNTHIDVAWPNTADPTQPHTTVHRTDNSQHLPQQWERALELNRPLLSYEELGNLFEAGPSKLHDALAKLVGLEQLTDGVQRLDTLRKELSTEDDQAKKLRRELKNELARSEDERAPRLRELLGRHKPDLDAIGGFVTDSPGSGSVAARLRELAEPALPTQDEIDTAVNRLRSALGEAAELVGDSVSGAEQRSTLLHQALELHREHGDQPCPVCGQATLDAAWSARARQRLDADEQWIKTARQAREAVRHSAEQLRSLITRVPALPETTDLELDTLDRARRARQHWANPPERDSDLAEHVATSYPELAAACTALRDEAAARLAQHQDAWSPIAEKLANWLGLARAARAKDQDLQDVRNAHEWLRDNTKRLRNEHLRPLAEHARRIWSRLRQQSNVDLGSIELTGNGTQRRVALHADIDGTESQALGVMSQGELHALALALFLPRATMDQSPFRFVVLDDPVQAMDPAKVDGFVQVLAELAQHRQIIVFSHDDRLADSARRSNVRARILEVHRGRNSEVTIENSDDPARSYVSEARAVAKSGLDPGVAEAVLPGLCRMAVEAAAWEIYSARRFHDGQDRDETERLWTESKSTGARIGLALCGVAGADLGFWLGGYPRRRHTLGICSQGAHEGLNCSPEEAVKSLNTTVEDLLLEGQR